jgi:hypothetical protein
VWFFCGVFCGGCVFRLDLSGCFGEYDEEDGEDEVQDDFDHDGRFLGGCSVFLGGRQQIFFGVCAVVRGWF